MHLLPDGVYLEVCRLHVCPLPELRVVRVVLVVVFQGGLPQGAVDLPHPPRSVANQLGEAKKQIL